MDEPVKPPSQQARRFFDVMPPSQSRPPATSRPVIVSNQPEQVDTMITTAPTEPEPTPAVETVAAPEAVTAPEPATPETHSDMSTSAEAMMQEEYEEVHHEIEPAAVPAPATTPEAPVDVTPAQAVPAPAVASQAVDVVAAAPTTPANITSVAPSTSAPAAIPEPATQTGVVNQAVVVHHQKPRSLGRDLILMLVLFVLIIVVIDGLLDSGAWKPAYNFPHTHFIKK